MTALTDISHGPAAGGAVDRLIVLLHGYGADGHDLIGLAPQLGAAFPDALFVAPHAPHPCGMAPAGREWFPLTDLAPERLAAGVQQAAPQLDTYLDSLVRRHPSAPMALLGFSQGCMMALAVGLARRPPLAAVLGFSGLLAAPPEAGGPKPPVMLVHGDADGVVPPFCLSAAESALQQAGIPVVAHLRPGLAHAIDPEGLRLGVEFLHRHTGRSES